MQPGEAGSADANVRTADAAESATTPDAAGARSVDSESEATAGAGLDAPAGADTEAPDGDRCAGGDAGVGAAGSGEHADDLTDPAERTPRRMPLALATWCLIGLVLVIVVVLLVVKITRGSTVVVSPPVTPASTGVVQSVESVPTSTFNAVAAPAPDAGTGPTVFHGQPPLLVDGKPGVVFVGAEFCPYCAAERWALVAALSRFGHFERLGATSSASDQVFPGVRTFSFDGASFDSTLIGFSGVELYGDQASTTAPAGYPALHRPDAEVQALLQRYDTPSVVPGAGSLPFVDVGNTMVLAGSQIGFSPGVLEGLSMAQIASDLADPTNPVTEAVVGAANEITAALCTATAGRPAAVCSTPAVARTAHLIGLNVR